MSLFACQEEGFSLFHLFGVVSSMFQPLLASSDLFRIVQIFISNNVTECFDNLLLYLANTLPLGIPEEFLGPNLCDSIILCQDHQFKVLYS